MSGKGPIVLDSSAWVEILGRGALSKTCEKELNSASRVVVPTVVHYEVYKKITAAFSDDRALSATAAMSQHETRDLTREIALLAADLSLQHRLGMADAIVLAHAHAVEATLITLDNDFAGIPGARVIRKQ